MTIPLPSSAEKGTIQQLIDAANPGDTIYLEAGTYDETIIIDRAVTIVGLNDVHFQVTSDKPIFSILADGVTLENIALTYTNEVADQPAIFVQSNHNSLRKLVIQSSNTAIYLDDAHDNLIEHVDITGDETLTTQQRHRAIDLWDSNRNIIQHCSIQYAEDGIYIENGEENVLNRNIVTNSRYGYHLMFTKKTELFANESYHNISGMMIMGTKGTKAHHNQLLYNQKNVQSLGLLLFDVKDAMIFANDIGYNRIGIVVEDATQNEIFENDVHHNFIGLQFKRATNNNIYHNEFNANVMQGQAEESMDNATNHNYWNDHSGLDLTGNGESDLPYTIDPFYLHLTNIFPPFRLLFQAPGMIFLDKLMHTPPEQQLIDHHPLMESPLEKTVDKVISSEYLVLVSSFLFITSLGLMILGVKKQ